MFLLSATPIVINIFSRSGRDFLFFKLNIQLFSRVKIIYHVVTDMKSIFREACPDNQKPVYILNDKVSQ